VLNKTDARKSLRMRLICDVELLEEIFLLRKKMIKTDMHPSTIDWSSVECCLSEARKNIEGASTVEQFQSIGLLCCEASLWIE
jgi:hypothetical protein